MGSFEDIAVLDLKFRIIVAAAVLTWVGVGMPILVVFESEVGFVIGAVAAVAVAYLTAKRLA